LSVSIKLNEKLLRQIENLHWENKSRKESQLSCGHQPQKAFNPHSPAIRENNCKPPLRLQFALCKVLLASSFKLAKKIA